MAAASCGDDNGLCFVLTDDRGEEQLHERFPGRRTIELNAADWEPADAWLDRTLEGDEMKDICATWAADRLKVEPNIIRGVSAALQRKFAARLLHEYRCDDPGNLVASLCAEVLGWGKPLPLDRHARWLAFARLLTPDNLPLVIITAREETLQDALVKGSQFAAIGFVVGIHACREIWNDLMKRPGWQRDRTLWKMATVLPVDVRAPAGRAEKNVEHFVRTHAPDSLPVLRAAQEAIPSASTDPVQDEQARSSAESLLFAMLQARPSTCGRFKLNTPLDFTFGLRPAEGDLVHEEARLVVEIDGYFHFQDPARYRRDRRKDELFQEHGWFVLRILARDVVERMEDTLRRIERTLARRLATLTRATPANHG